MSITLRIINFIDKVHLQNFFVEKDNKIMLNFSFDANRVEDVIDQLLKTQGQNYRPNQLEQDIMQDLDF